MITLFLCGDVMLARGIDQILAKPCDPTLHESYLRDAREYIEIAEDVSGPIPRHASPEYPWGDALAILDAARPDVRIINLETSITRSDDFDHRKGIHYRVSPENASCLKTARINICVLGNNHVLDWGPAGLLDTLETLDRLGIARCGAGHDLDAAVHPAVAELGPLGRVVVFSVGCADAGVPPSWRAAKGRPGVHVLTELDDEAVTRLRGLIEPWRRAGSIIVLSIHWGPNWGFELEPEHQRFAYRMIDEAGVDVVHGHSSHHVKGIEVHDGHPILYGCGDLLTDYEGIRGHQVYRGELGLLHLVTLDAAGALVRLEMAPTRMQRFRLTAAVPEDAQWLARTLTKCGAPLGTRVDLDGSRLFLKWT